VGLGHPLGPSWLAGGGRREDVGVADAQVEVEEAGGGDDAAVLGVGLLHRVAVLQRVDAHPGLIWRGDMNRQGRFYFIYIYIYINVTND